MGGTFPRGAEPFSLCAPFFRVSQRISAACDLRTRAPPALTHTQSHIPAGTLTHTHSPGVSPRRTARALPGKKEEKPQLGSPLFHLLRFSSAQ